MNDEDYILKLEGTIDDLKAENSDLDSDLTRATKRIDELENDVDGLKDERDQAQKDSDSFEEMYKEEKEKKEELEKILDEKNKELEKALHTAANQGEVIDDLIAEVKQLKKDKLSIFYGVEVKNQSTVRH